MSTTTPHDSSDQTAEAPHFHAGSLGAERYYAELTRITAWLFVAVVAAMTFLLTVGYQHPHKQFQYALYASLIILPLNLILSVLAHGFQVRRYAAKRAVVTSTVKGDDHEKLVKASAASARRLKVVRGVQQVLFVLAVIAVAGMALSAASFFFGLSAATTSGAATQ